MIARRQKSTISVLVLLLALSVPGGWITSSASRHSSKDSILNRTVVHPINAAQAAPDFDGDKLPDLALARISDSGYKIDISFSSLLHPVSLSFVSNEPAIGLLTYDIDNDNDNDIVIASATTLRPLAVWLGDGNGNFDRDDYLLTDDAPDSDSAPVCGQNGCPAYSVSTSPDEKFPLGATIVSIHIADTAQSETVPERPQDPALSVSAFRLPSRGPPPNISI